LSSEELVKNLNDKNKENVMVFVYIFVITNILMQLLNYKNYMDDGEFVGTVIFQWSMSVLLVTLNVIFYKQTEKKAWLYELILLLITIRNLIPLLNLDEYKHRLKFHQRTDQQVWRIKFFFPMGQLVTMFMFSFSIMLTFRH